MTQLRVASDGEVEQVVRLIMSAYKDYAYLICNSEEDDVVLTRMQELARHHEPLPMSLHTVRVMSDDAGHILGGFIAYPIVKIMQFYQSIYQALIDNGYFTTLDAPIKLSPRLMGILGADSTWMLPYANAYYLDAFTIEEHFRGKGLARPLMEYVKVRAKEEHCTSIVLLARENKVPFYQRLGFAKSQFLDGGIEEDFFVLHLPFA